MASSKKQSKGKAKGKAKKQTKASKAKASKKQSQPKAPATVQISNRLLDLDLIGKGNMPEPITVDGTTYGPGSATWGARVAGAPIALCGPASPHNQEGKQWEMTCALPEGVGGKGVGGKVHRGVAPNMASAVAWARTLCQYVAAGVAYSQWPKHLKGATPLVQTTDAGKPTSKAMASATIRSRAQAATKEARKAARAAAAKARKEAEAAKAKEETASS